MTTEGPQNRHDAGPSVHVVRARKLLVGGLVGGIGTAILVMIIFTVVDGAQGLGSAALGAGMVLFFYAVGQLVMVKFADAGARTLMLVSMTSYTGRVIILGLILLVFAKGDWDWVDNIAVFIATIAVVAGWIGVELVVFSRLRIGTYDQEYTAPEQHSGPESAVAGSVEDPNRAGPEGRNHPTQTGGSP
jgi:hypothetical protein